ncbi:MAG: AlpA family phage regulatory protein [Halothiobacillaceae bacterium]|nr:AlpA family phage regulatory protein [Halothiobacillaceae bacterium]
MQTKASTPQSSRIYRPARAAAFLDVSRSTVWRLVKAGHLPPPIKIGAQAVGWTEQTLLDFVASRTTGGAQ